MGRFRNGSLFLDRLDISPYNEVNDFAAAGL